MLTGVRRSKTPQVLLGYPQEAEICAVSSGGARDARAIVKETRGGSKELVNSTHFPGGHTRYWSRDGGPMISGVVRRHGAGSRALDPVSALGECDHGAVSATLAIAAMESYPNPRSGTQWGEYRDNSAANEYPAWHPVRDNRTNNSTRTTERYDVTDQRSIRENIAHRAAISSTERMDDKNTRTSRDQRRPLQYVAPPVGDQEYAYGSHNGGYSAGLDSATNQSEAELARFDIVGQTAESRFPWQHDVGIQCSIMRYVPRRVASVDVSATREPREQPVNNDTFRSSNTYRKYPRVLNARHMFGRCDSDLGYSTPCIGLNGCYDDEVIGRRRNAFDQVSHVAQREPITEQVDRNREPIRNNRDRSASDETPKKTSSR